MGGQVAKIDKEGLSIGVGLANEVIFLSLRL
jgi:hypothetical protein